MITTREKEKPGELTSVPKGQALEMPLLNISQGMTRAILWFLPYTYKCYGTHPEQNITKILKLVLRGAFRSLKI